MVRCCCSAVVVIHCVYLEEGRLMLGFNICIFFFLQVMVAVLRVL